MSSKHKNKNEQDIPSASAFNQEIAKKSLEETLFETLMKDPIKKAFLFNLLHSEKENIEKYREEEKRKAPILSRKQLHCESPTALLRRRALEKNGDTKSPTSAQESNNSTPVPFNELLNGVVAYVEISSNHIDRSSGAKMLMKSMGAEVVDTLKRGVTHVVFKDGSFTTYQHAKLLKVHLVSVLWLEAIRKSHIRVSEKNYPALGTEVYDINVSEIYQDYEKVVNDEYRRSLAVENRRTLIQTQRKRLMTNLPPELTLSPNCSLGNSSFSRTPNIVRSSQQYELESIISHRSLYSQRSSTESCKFDTTSDGDSECGIINGEPFTPRPESRISETESQIYHSSDHLDTSNPIVKNLEEKEKNVQHVKNFENDQSNNVLVKNDNPETNKTVSTSSTRSISVLSRRSVSNRKTIHNIVGMGSTSDIKVSDKTQQSTYRSRKTTFGRIESNRNKVKRKSPRLAENNISPSKIAKPQILSCHIIKNNEKSSLKSSDLSLQNSVSKSPRFNLSNHDLATELNSECVKTNEENTNKSNASPSRIDSISSTVTLGNTLEDVLLEKKNSEKFKKNNKDEVSQTIEQSREQSVASRLSKNDSLPNIRKSVRINQRNSGNDAETNPVEQNIHISTTTNIKNNKTLRKLYNPNQCVVHITEPVETAHTIQVPVSAPVVSAMPKTLTVALNRLYFKTHQNILNKQKKNDKTEIVQTKLDKSPEKVLSTIKNKETNKITPKQRRSLRLEKKLTFPNSSRRSTLEFVEESTVKKKKVQKTKKVISTIVCTRMHKADVQMFMQIVKKLGNFIVEDEVTVRTTHLVAGESKRTVNILRAICRGCWILKEEWLLSSLEAGKWLPEEDYELTDFSPAVRQCRLERQAFGDFYSMDVFSSYGPIYISRGSLPRRSDLEELVSLCKGSVVKDLHRAKIVVGLWVDNNGVTCVTETWVLDSITFNKTKLFKKYLMKCTS